MTTKRLVYTALMTAMIAVLGFVPAIPLPVMPVPIVLQNIGIFLAAILLGRKYGTLSVIVLLLLVATGLPLLSGGRGGIGVFAGPSAGFLFMYPVITYLIGLVRDLYFNKMNFVVLLGTTIVFGVLLLDIVGTIIMGWITHLPISKSVMLSVVFMPGDLLKAIIERFNGGPVGIDALASSIGEERGTIEDVYEPYLLQNGLLKRTSRGRMVTDKAYKHLGIEKEN